MGKWIPLSCKNSTCPLKKKTLKGFIGRLLRRSAVFVLLMAIYQCADPQPGVAEEVLNIPLTLEVDRFDLKFDKAGVEDLPALKAQYPFFFPPQYADSIWMTKLTDTLQQQIRREVRLAFRDFEPYAADLELFYKHAKFYFPQTRVPRVITLTTDVDYQNRVILTDSLLLVGLDNYLGPEHEFYANMSRYIAQELDPDLMVSDVASAFSAKHVPTPRSRSFVAQMVYYGKVLYLKDRLMPMAPDSVKIGYSASQWTWAQQNESQIWRYFVERELLFSTDNKLGPRFLEPAPFSKFRLVLDNESPGRIGRYMGWQIVRAFMKNNEVGLKELLSMPGEEVFQRSNYKPPK